MRLGLVRYPVPLGRGRFCSLDLPNPLTQEDADRIAMNIKTIVLDRSSAPHFAELRLRDEAFVDAPADRDAVREDLNLRGSMGVATFSIGEHISAGIVFGETQDEADARARRFVDGWNDTEGLANCQRGRIGDSENVGRLLGIIAELKRGSCWCLMGIGHPGVTRHTEACKAAAEAVGEKL